MRAWLRLIKKTGKEKMDCFERSSFLFCTDFNHASKKKKVLICLTGDNVAGLNPQTGKNLLENIRFPPRRMVIACPTPVVSGNYLFLTSFYDGSLMLELDSKKTAVRRTLENQGRKMKSKLPLLHCMISTPCIKGDYVYGFDSYGQLRCLNAKTGKRIWEDLTVVSQESLGDSSHG